MLLEIRTYRLRPGARDEFVRVMQDECVPLLESFGIRVVGCGASVVNEEGREEAYLIRAFTSLVEHRTQEKAFYGSEQWRSGPRDAILSRLMGYHSVVIEDGAALAEAIMRG